MAFAAPPGQPLQVYFVDVEGGQATLIVTPSGGSMLVDAGWPGHQGRDAERIVAAAKLAGLKQIDYFLLTHYHTDHFGGLPQLAARIPIATFVDHGANTETGAQAAQYSAEYAQLLTRAKHLVVQPGDRIPLRDVDVKVVAARGVVLSAPLAGARPNPVCATTQPQAADPSENARSVGFLLTFGKFRFIDLGDLTWNKELDLVCPASKVGAVDVFLTSHHGVKISNSPALLAALSPRVAIMNNGARKGGDPEAWRIIRASAGLEDLWQLHYSVAGGEKNNAAEPFLANPQENCSGNWLKLTARPDGSFAVSNSRNGYQKAYPAKKG
jgi:beta-lactamase superfamily II metal-dependent hydrolase